MELLKKCFQQYLMWKMLKNAKNSTKDRLTPFNICAACVTLFTYSGWTFCGLRANDGGTGGVQKGPTPKICHIYPTMMKLGTCIPNLKKTPKMFEWRGIPIGFCWHQYFFTGKQNFSFIKKDRYRSHFNA